MDIDAALRSGDREAIARHLTVASRPLVAAMAGVAVPGQPSPFVAAAGARPLQVHAVAIEGQRAVVTVRAGQVERQWVLHQEQGAWRLDLFETSLRRPWGGKL